MYLVTSSEMREIEAKTVTEYGVPASILMENAGSSVVNAISAEFGTVYGKRISVFCGTGNNGGDGFVAARHLASEGAVPHIFITGDETQMSGHAAENLKAASKYGIMINRLNSVEDLGRVHNICASADIIIDSLFGTGLNRVIEGFTAKLIIYINSLRKMTVSIDVPSGVNSDTGDIMGAAVEADMTVTFGLPKLGISVYPGYQCAGKLILADINFPPKLLNEPRKNVLITENMIRAMLPYRLKNSNKGSFGPVLVIGGSPGLCGAVSLASKAALKCGAGIVNACVPQGQYATVKAASEELIVTSMKENRTGSFSAENFTFIIELINKAKVVLIGPGAGSDTEARELMRKVIAACEKPMVIDADGINAVAQDKNCLNKAKKDVIITPHMGEMARLINMPIENVIKSKMKTASEFAAEFGLNVLLKDGRSLLSDKEGNIYVNTTGNNGLASPGTGDVLAGVIAALMAQNADTAAAGITGSFIHGLAADLLLKEMTEEGITASEVVRMLPSAVKKIRRQED